MSDPAKQDSAMWSAVDQSGTGATLADYRTRASAAGKGDGGAGEGGRRGASRRLRSSDRRSGAEGREVGQGYTEEEDGE
jgi:hypothetical protein